MTTNARDLPMAPDAAIGACCSLESADLPQRLAEWKIVRDHASLVETVPGGIRLRFEADEPMASIADLVAREAECCGFYRFGLTIEGSTRQLEVTTGPGGEPAIRALLALD